MLIKYLRDANRIPVACVTSSARGKVGWSVYHPNDHIQVPSTVVKFDGKDVRVEPQRDENGDVVMVTVPSHFTKVKARKIAGERECDLEKSIIDLHRLVPCERTFSVRRYKSSHYCDQKGNRVTKDVVHEVDEQDSIGDYIVAMLRSMHRRSLEAFK